MVNKVVAGESVKISGTCVSKTRKAINLRRKSTVLHATSIKYLHRKEVFVTKEDIKIFINLLLSKSKLLIERLTAMFAPNIIGHDDVKRGLLRSIVWRG